MRYNFNPKNMYGNRSLRLLSRNFIFNWDQDKIAFISIGAAFALLTEKAASWIFIHYPAHLMVRSLLVTLLASHFFSALALIHDLFKVSKRTNKSLWAFIILTLPAANLFLYRLFMRRHKSYSRRTYLY